MQEARRFWGWGVEGAGPSVAQQRKIGETIAARFGGEPRDPIAPPTIDELDAPRTPGRAARVARVAVHRRPVRARRAHLRQVVPRRVARAAPRLLATARSGRDPARRGRHRRAPRLVLRSARSPRCPTAAARRSSAASSATSTTTTAARSASTSARSTGCSRSTESRARRGSRPACTAPPSRTNSGPHGLTLRHFPQSFEFSTLGGWLATRSGGHYATLHTHIDDFVESIRAVTPRGVWESRRLPGSGAGPSPDRMLLGSEGILGVITEAWMRLQDRPTFRASATARFSTFERRRPRPRARSRSRASTPPTAGCSTRSRRSSPAPTTRATRSCSSRSSRPTTRSARGSRARSSARATTAARRRRRASSVRDGAQAEGARDGAAGLWRNAFIRAPYTRDALVGLGVISETFETACTWDAFAALHEASRRPCSTPREAAGAWPAVVTCRFTHVYPDGPAPYFTVLALGTEPEQLAQWEAIKAAAGDAIAQLGRHDHAPPRGRPRPPPLVRPPAPRAVRGRAARGQGRGRPGRHPQPRRAHRPCHPDHRPRLMTYRAVIFDLGGVVFPSPFEAFDAYDHGNDLKKGTDARADPHEQRIGRVGRARTRRADAWTSSSSRSRRKPLAAGFQLDARRLMGLIGSSLGPRPEMAQAITQDPRERTAHRGAHEQLDRRDQQRSSPTGCATRAVRRDRRVGGRGAAQARPAHLRSWCSPGSTCSRPRPCSSTTSA